MSFDPFVQNPCIASVVPGMSTPNWKQAAAARIKRLSTTIRAKIAGLDGFVSLGPVVDVRYDARDLGAWIDIREDSKGVRWWSREKSGVWAKEIIPK